MLALSGCQSSIFKPNLGSHFRLPHWAGGSKPIPDLPDSLDQPAATDGVVRATEPTAAGPEDLATILGTAHQTFRNGRLTDAAQHYQAVLKLDPDHSVAHHRLAIIADRQQDYTQADRHYQSATKSSPQDTDLLSDFAYSKLLRGDLDASKKLLRQALAIDPTHSYSLKNLGWIQAREGHYDAALETFRKAGSEAEAQENISRLFPQGRPSTTKANDPNLTPSRTLPNPLSITDPISGDPGHQTLPEPTIPLVPSADPPPSLTDTAADPVVVPAGAKEPIVPANEFASQPRPSATTVDLPSQPFPAAGPIPTTPGATTDGVIPTRSTNGTSRMDPEFSRSAARLGLSIGPGSLLPYSSTAPATGNSLIDADKTTPVAPPSKLIPAPAATNADPLSSFETELQDDPASEREAVRERLSPSPGPTVPTIP